MSKKSVLCVVADGKVNAGEVDYASAFLAAIKEHGSDENEYFICKVDLGTEPKNTLHENADQLTASIRKLPEKKSDFDHVPLYSEHGLNQVLELSEMITVVGLGRSTLAVLKDIKENTADGEVEKASYITHMMGSSDDLQWIADTRTTLFAPMERKDLQALNADAAGRTEFYKLTAVPHTNTFEICRNHLAEFNKTENGVVIQEHVASGKPFAVVVINAGYKDKTSGVHQPYTKSQAFAHGLALGRSLPKDTLLMANHGGPRNLADEQEAGQETSEGFIEGYRIGQQEQGGDPVVVFEPFRFGMDYDAIKASYLLTQNENCVAYISNAEGYGTMDGALKLIDQEKYPDMLVGMFPFDLLYQDVTGQRQANITKYHNAGIAVLKVGDNGNLVIEPSPNAGKQDIQQDPTLQIIETLGLTGGKAVKPVTPKPSF